MKYILLLIYIFTLLACTTKQEPIQKKFDRSSQKIDADILVSPNTIQCIAKDSSFWANVKIQENSIQTFNDNNNLEDFISKLDKNDPLSLIKCEQWFNYLSAQKSTQKSDSIFYRFEKFHNEVLMNIGKCFIGKKDFELKDIEEKDSCYSKLINFRNNYGLQVRRSNNKLYIASDLNYLLLHTKNHISESLKKYLSIKQLELNQGYISNGILLINFDQLGERIATWEKYRKEYPNSLHESEIIELQSDYLNAFLFGTEQSGLFDEANNKLLPIIQKDYEQFILKYPNLSVTKSIKERYEKLQSHNFTNTTS